MKILFNKVSELLDKVDALEPEKICNCVSQNLYFTWVCPKHGTMTLADYDLREGTFSADKHVPDMTKQEVREKYRNRLYELLYRSGYGGWWG